MKILKKKFYQRNPKKVARDLLGKTLVRKIGNNTLKGIIVETEAYYGENDPASRAYHGMKSYNKMMWDEPGKIFIYNVHKYWMFNVVAHEVGKVGAVLIRAIHPIEGIDVMMKNRKTDQIEKLTSGPGKLTIALKIDKSLNGKWITKKDSGIFITEGIKPKKISKSKRIGVRKDLEEELRFFIDNDKFVSR